MKRSSHRLAPASRSGSRSASSSSPACDKSTKAARKFVTEFIVVCGRVIMGIIRWRLGGEPLAAQLREGFGEHGERARGALGIDRPLRLVAEVRAHGLDGGKL